MIEPNSTYLITGVESLHMLRTKRKKRYKRFVITSDRIDKTTAQKFENNLNRFHSSCGCNTGNHFLSTAIVLGALYFLVNGFPDINWILIAKIISGLALIALIGKITGRIMDAIKFDRTVEDLYKHLV